MQLADLVQAIAFDNIHDMNDTLISMRNDVNQISKEGFHFKTFKNVVDGKVKLRTGFAYKRNRFKAFVNTDFNKDHRIYAEYFINF